MFTSKAKIQKVAQFNIIGAENCVQLQDQVNEAIKNGWQPFGHPFTKNNSVEIYQTLVFYKID